MKKGSGLMEYPRVHPRMGFGGIPQREMQSRCVKGTPLKRVQGKPCLVYENLKGFDRTRGTLFYSREIIEGRDGLGRA